MSKPPRTADDYRQVARLHIENLDRSFLAELGVPFLSALYRAIDEADQTVLITESRNDQIVGFVSGGPSLGPIYRAILPKVFLWGPSLAVRLLSPRRLKRVMDILRHSPPDDPSVPDMELLSIAVDPSARGTGVSKALYDGLVAHCRAQNMSAFRIMVGETLAPAHRFYTKMGAKPVSTMELHPGEQSVLYVHEL